MDTFELIFHEELNMINCFCGFMGISHNCTQKIKGAIKIIECPIDCKICEKEVIRKEYNSIRWAEDRDNYKVCGTFYDKLGTDPICTNYFCEICYSSLDDECDCIK